MPELKDVINDLPPDLQVDEPDDNGTPPDGGTPPGDNPAVPPDDAPDGDEPPAGGDKKPGEEEEDEDQDDYFTSSGSDDDDKPAADKPPQTPQATDENSYILQNLSKIQVRIVAADDKVKTVEVYGYGDLPRDMKGFATPYEQGVFNQSVIAQENRAKELQSEFRNQKMQADTEEYVLRENRAIAEDLTELRQEGIFPKFKGVPGSKEFNESEGAKEFDKVIAFMNEQNDNYGKAAQGGKAYRHIGFREAFVMLNGPNPKAAEKAEDAARRKVAGKLASSGGTSADSKTVSNKRVTNINELAREFEQFVGSGAK
jgi:hypothetical protein